MRWIPVILSGCVALFMGQFLARTVYIHYNEFMPAVNEWHEAHDRGDAQGMREAYAKELKAHERSTDPLWFAR